MAVRELLVEGRLEVEKLVVLFLFLKGSRQMTCTYESKYVNSNFPWPFYIAEAGWFMRANNYMLGKGF